MPRAFIVGLCAAMLVAGPARGQLQLRIEAGATPRIFSSGPTGAVSQVLWSATATGPAWFHLGEQLVGGAPVADGGGITNARFYRAVLLPASNMVWVAGGPFTRGDFFNDGPAGERPTNTVSLRSFFLDRWEVSLALWSAVRDWALTNGYTFDQPGAGKGAGHPVHSVTWHDALKWCNARSEQAGRVPAYYTTPTQTAVYRGGALNLSNDCVNWNVDGFRLPTEAEWEKAARGGAAGWRFGRGNTLSHADANYFAATYLGYDTTGVTDFHPAFNDGVPPFTSPCGAFPANAFGLHDLTGNVWEWCWDGYDAAWYATPAATQPDTRGPATARAGRVLRGGSWFADASFARSACRVAPAYSAPTTVADEVGFRCAVTAPVGAGQPVDAARLTEWARLADGRVRFTVSNVTPGRVLVVEQSADLQTWQGGWTNVPAGAAVGFTNWAGTAGGGFFRARQTR